MSENENTATAPELSPVAMAIAQGIDTAVHAVDKARAAKDRKNAAARAKRLAKTPIAREEVKTARAARKEKPKVAAAPTPQGGAREGAGRKPLYKEAMTKAITVKVSERQFKEYHSIPEGGTAWLRRGLDQLIAAKKAK